jgi:hypothetical protein
MKTTGHQSFVFPCLIGEPIRTDDAGKPIMPIWQYYDSDSWTPTLNEVMKGLLD